MGAPGAILSGQGVNDAAFEQTATGVTIEYLTIENFVPGADSIAVNHDTGPNWTIKYNTIKDTPAPGWGSGHMMSSRTTASRPTTSTASTSKADRPTSRSRTTRSAPTTPTAPTTSRSFVVSYAVSSDVATIVTKGPMNLVAGHQVDIGVSGQ